MQFLQIVFVCYRLTCIVAFTMPRVIEYIGDPKSVGRFGVLKTGDVIEVTEHEYHSALQSSDFRKVETDAEFDTSQCPPPRATDYFDLTTLRWNHSSLPIKLYRKTKRTINAMAQAVEQVTGRPVPHGNLVQRKETVEAILSIAHDFGWTKPAEQ